MIHYCEEITSYYKYSHAHNNQLTPSLTHVMASVSPDPVLKKEGLSLPLDAATNREANLTMFMVEVEVGS